MKNKNNNNPNPQQLSPKQKRIAAMAAPFNKITGADFKMLKQQRKK